MATDTQPWQGLRLDPLDVLFFRDGRPFDAASRVNGALPNPQTLAGALRTALLARTDFKFQEFAKARQTLDMRAALKACGAPEWVVNARFRGPWLGLARKDKPIEPLLPLPATLAQKAGVGWLRAKPLQAGELPGWAHEKNDKESLLPLWRKGKADTKAGGGFLTLTGLRAFLANKDFGNPEFLALGELYGFDDRTGIRIDMQTLTSAEGEIYGIRLLSLKPKVAKRPGIGDDPYSGSLVCLYAEVLPGPGITGLRPYLAEPVPFGGEGKYVRVETTEPCNWSPIDSPAIASAPRQSLWYLATPAFLGSDPSKPPLRQGLTLRAAASGSGMAVSGWDVARNGPRPTRFAVPAGAVYFVEGPVTAEGPFNFDKDEMAEGWGFALQGTW